MEYTETYLKNLENLVSSVKAPVLEVSIRHLESYSPNIPLIFPPVFKNGWIERLMIQGNCKENIQLVM